MAATTIQLGAITVEVTRKDIRNVHLSVYPPDGLVRIAAPLRMKLDTIRVYAISKLTWIKQQQRKMQAQERETPREYIERESHYLWGKRYLLKVIEHNAPPAVDRSHNKLVLKVRPNTPEPRRQEILDEWYRRQLREAIPALLEKWEPILGVKVNQVFIQRMKTKWGSCTHAAARIRLNTDLAKKPPECLEYLIVHELTHLIEPTHNTRFIALMDHYLPKWRYHRQTLNRLPVRHESWEY
jgi:predicted metal-dependent hydrolase